MRFTLNTAVAISLAFGCGPQQWEHADMSVQNVDMARRSGAGGFLGLDVLLTDVNGAPIDCSVGALDVHVSIAVGGSTTFTDLPLQDLAIRCNESRTADVAIVADNSRSALDYLPQIQDGAHRLADSVLGAGGRVSVVRVETEAHTLIPLSDNAEDIHAAIDTMEVTRGWSALYDGFRMANETLGGTITRPLEADRYDSVDTFCDNSRTTAIVAFTDGDDNNSAGESQSEQSLIWYPGDGIHTTFEDVLDLRVDDITTPFYTIGLGYYVRDGLMSELANRTGGRFLDIPNPDAISDALAGITEYTDSTHQVCAALPAQECGWYTVRVDTKWSDSGETVQRTTEHEVHLPCDHDPTGRTASILLTLGNPGIPDSTAQQLSQKAVTWVSPVLRPKVLVVLDDGHHGERPEDATRIRQWLMNDTNNLAVDYLEEPQDGVAQSAFDDYDVVWFSNPGYPMDDRRSFESLLTFSSNGGGVVLQGDDMSWSFGNEWSMAPLTHLEWIDNGIRECGSLVNNDKHDAYSVTLSADHPILNGIDGTTFMYGDDIDFTRPLGNGEMVLARANLGYNACREDRPVLVGWDPGDSEP